MSVTNIKIFPTKGDGNTKAFGRFTVAECINISFSVVNGKNGLFVSLPSHKGKDAEGNDKWYNDVFVEDKAILADLQTKCLAAYNSTVGGGASDQGSSPEPTNQDAPPNW